MQTEKKIDEKQHSAVCPANELQICNSKNSNKKLLKNMPSAQIENQKPIAYTPLSRARAHTHDFCSAFFFSFYLFVICAVVTTVCRHLFCVCVCPEQKLYVQKRFFLVSYLFAYIRHYCIHLFYYYFYYLCMACTNRTPQP